MTTFTPEEMSWYGAALGSVYFLTLRKVGAVSKREHESVEDGGHGSEPNAFGGRHR